MKILALAGAAAIAIAAPLAMLHAAPGDAPHAPIAITRDMVKAEADKVWARADVNQDGRIDAADREARMLKHFDAMDTNHDGQVSRDEYLAALRAHAKGWHGGDWHGGEWPGHGPDHHGAGPEGAGPDAAGHGGDGDRHHPMIARTLIIPALHDAVKADAVTRADFDAAVAARFDKLDTNHDGTLDRAELRAAQPRGPGEWHGEGHGGKWGHRGADMPPPPLGE